MKYTELEHEAVMAIVRHDNHKKKDREYAMTAPRNPSARGFIDHHRRKNNLRGDLLLSMMGTVESDEKKIRHTALSNLPSIQKRNFEKKLLSNEIFEVEEKKVARLKKLSGELQVAQKKYGDQQDAPTLEQSTRRLLQLEELKLKHTFTDEGEAAALLNSMARTGYSILEAQILGATGKKANARMQTLFDELPAFAASPETLPLVKEFKTLLDLKPGHLPYTIDGTDMVQSVHVCDLISETVPDLDDVN